jgi:tRNA U34 5-methylaminomethyl-2-thiouridine-forming methyltransferase MnmC
MKNENEMRSFKGSLGQYKFLSTKDKTPTLFSEAFQEACHSLDGAWEETCFNYLEGCEIPQKSKEGPLSILEVGFGPGVGLQVVSDFFQKSRPQESFSFYSFELDRGLVEWALSHWPSKGLPLEGEFIEDGDLSFFKGKIGQGEIFIFMGDARKTLLMAKEKNLLKPVQAIFQDPFSPKKNPSLWTLEWFNDLRSVSSQDVLLSTYSSSSSIRKSLKEAGWILTNAPGFSSKRTSTRARLEGPSDQDLEAKLERVPFGPLLDKDLSL